MAPKRYKLHKRLKPKQSRLKKILKNRFFWFGIIGCLLLGGSVYGIFLTPLFQIRHIEIWGNEKIPPEKIQELAQEYIPKKFGFFQINHLLLANTSKAAENIKIGLPEMESVVIVKSFPNKIKIVVKERGAIAVWCQTKEYTVEIENSETQEKKSFRQCFVLDAHGVIFEKKEPEREVIISEEGKNNAALGEQVIDRELLARILRFQKQLDSFALFEDVGLRVLTLSVVSKERVKAKISEGWEIYLNPIEDIDWQITKVKLVLEQEISSAKRPNLEYIDLRFGDQAYIKYR